MNDPNYPDSIRTLRESAGIDLTKKPYHLLLGDCIEVMKTLPANSVDALVSDPPYGWRFMGKAWDGADIEKAYKRDKAYRERVVKEKGEWRIGSDGRRRRRRAVGLPGGIAAEGGAYEFTQSANLSFQKWTEEWAREAFRILKPGAHALIFCGPRTYHRMATGVEDAGFEIRDQLQWIFGSGFPKSLDISKAVDKCFGKTGKTVATETRMNEPSGIVSVGQGERKQIERRIVEAESAAAAAWKGWGTALKPANEPIVLARKPLEKDIVAKNVLKYGTGGINVDAGRIESPDTDLSAVHRCTAKQPGHTVTLNVPGHNQAMYSPKGRFPSNVLLDETAAAMLDEQSGESRSVVRHPTGGVLGHHHGQERKLKDQTIRGLSDSGGASRFFYVAKTSKHERNYGLEHLPSKSYKMNAPPKSGHEKNADLEGKLHNNNNHPTVKPFTLMRYLVRLITPPGGVVLDPFLGSGTTGAVAVACGFRFIGIEKEPQYMEIAKGRLESVKLGSGK